MMWSGFGITYRWAHTRVDFVTSGFLQFFPKGTPSLPWQESSVASLMVEVLRISLLGQALQFKELFSPMWRRRRREPGDP
jgi:hypothetical protein